jgi:hypothetical protein
MKSSRAGPSNSKSIPRRRARRQRNIDTQSLEASQPTAYVAKVPITRKFRFSASNTGGSVITGSCLMNLMHVAATSTTSYSCISAVRIRKIEVWGPPVTGAAGTSEATVIWAGLHSPPKRIGDQGTVQMPAHIVTRPNRFSFANLWTLTGAVDITSGLFHLDCPQYSIIEITVQYMETDITSNPARLLTVAAATAGNWYHNFLDNTALNAVTVGPLLWTPIGDVTVLAAFG